MWLRYEVRKSCMRIRKARMMMAVFWFADWNLLVYAHNSIVENTVLPCRKCVLSCRNGIEKRSGTVTSLSGNPRTDASPCSSSEQGVVDWPKGSWKTCINLVVSCIRTPVWPLSISLDRVVWLCLTPGNPLSRLCVPLRVQLVCAWSMSWLSLGTRLEFFWMDSCRSTVEWFYWQAGQRPWGMCRHRSVACAGCQATSYNVPGNLSQLWKYLLQWLQRAIEKRRNSKSSWSNLCPYVEMIVPFAA